MSPAAEIGAAFEIGAPPPAAAFPGRAARANDCDGAAHGVHVGLLAHHRARHLAELQHLSLREVLRLIQLLQEPIQRQSLLQI